MHLQAEARVRTHKHMDKDLEEVVDENVDLAVEVFERLELLPLLLGTPSQHPLAVIHLWPGRRLGS